MSYLLSVIIPTKDRYIYLKECIDTLSQLDKEKVEVVISDNTIDNREFVNFLESKYSDFHNIKYYHSTETLSQTGNSDLALSKATGEYCCYIGDDDTIAEYAIELTEYLKANDIKACVFNMATYHWPDVVYEGKEQPSLTFDLRPKRIQLLKGEKVLKQVLSEGIQKIGFIPRVYHGIISKAVLDQIKDITGSYFPGPSPDMANGIASLLLIDKYIYCRYPVVISGFSFKSAGGMGLRGEHKGKLTGVKQLSPDVEKEWTTEIPKLWLGYTIWLEAGIKAIQRMKREDLMSKINYHAMYAKSYLRYPEYRDVFRNQNKGLCSYIKFGYECCRFMIKWTINKIEYKIRVARGLQFISYDRSITLTDAFNMVNNISNNK